MLTEVYYGCLALACLVASSDWRRGVYLAIVLDFLRDPVRKLDPDESVIITVSVLGLWGVITLSAWSRSQAEIRQLKNTNPKLWVAFQAMVFATIPGAVLSMFLYPDGYKMVALGMVSYLAPLAGIVLGAAFPRTSQDIPKLLMFYSLVNGIALSGVLAQYLSWEVPALGGLRGMVWIRYSQSDVVDLIAGFYRSPDIMGLHAAQVVMFSMILTAYRPQRPSYGWGLLIVFGALCLLLSGRRKMLGMPLVFLGVVAVLAYVRGLKNVGRTFIPLVGLSAIVGGGLLIFNDDFVADEYVNFASTLFTDGATRSEEIVVGSVIGTIQQSGVIGAGIGSATQGSYHVTGGFTSKQWQEDGVSRVFKELGVWGVLCIAYAGLSLIAVCRLRVQSLSERSGLATLQLMLFAAVIANLFSFTISHQQYSGDPPSAIIVLMLLGMALSIRDNTYDRTHLQMADCVVPSQKVL